MRPHHFVLVLVIVVTYLLVFDSAINMSRFKPKQENQPDTVSTMPWNSGN